MERIKFLLNKQSLILRIKQSLISSEIKYWWIFLMILLIPAATSLLVPGFYGASDDLHIAWLQQMDKAIKSGQIPPRFVPDLSYGFGYPLFNFVFPLPFYMGEVFHLLGLNFVDSIKAVFFLSIFLSGFFMYFFLREFLDHALSFAGAIIYTYAPYRAVDLYIRGAIGEIVAFVFLPVIALAVVKITPFEKSHIGWKWIGIGGLGIGGLILSHNISAYMFLPFIIWLIILRLIANSSQIKQKILGVFLTFFLGLLLSIYFWLPAIVDSELMRYDTVFNFADHFPTLIQLITPYWGYGASVPGPYDGMSFFLGFPTLVLLFLTPLLAIKLFNQFEADLKVILVWVLSSFLIALFFMNYRSAFLWDNLPLLPYFQFPWRFLIVTTFLSPLLLIIFKKFSFKGFISLAFVIFTVLLSVNFFHPQDFLGRTDEYYLNKYIPNPSASLEYQLTQEEYLRLPKDTKVRPDRRYPLIFGEEGLEIGAVQRLGELDSKIEIESESSFLLNYSKYSFPGWYARVDGKDARIIPGNPFGHISVNIPLGKHTVFIGFKETNLKLILNLISLVALLVILSLILVNSKRKANILS